MGSSASVPTNSRISHGLMSDNWMNSSDSSEDEEEIQRFLHCLECGAVRRFSFFCRRRCNSCNSHQVEDMLAENDEIMRNRLRMNPANRIPEPTIPSTTPAPHPSFNASDYDFSDPSFNTFNFMTPQQPRPFFSISNALNQIANQMSEDELNRQSNAADMRKYIKDLASSQCAWKMIEPRHIHVVYVDPRPKKLPTLVQREINYGSEATTAIDVEDKPESNNLQQLSSNVVISSDEESTEASDTVAAPPPPVCPCNACQEEEEDCAICAEMLYFNKDGESVKLPCGHRFHCGCILEWLIEGKPSCPMCRQPVYPTNEVDSMGKQPQHNDSISDMNASVSSGLLLGRSPSLSPSRSPLRNAFDSSAQEVLVGGPHLSPTRELAMALLASS